ncbi:hypothetical protein Bca101_053745 [Brassica carinata]
MDSYFSLTTVAAAAISFYALFGSIFFNRKSSKSNQENKTNTSSLTLLAPPSSSSPPNCLHHVFPSFHGTDVRTNFLSHIIKELRSKGIDVFIDNDIERSKSIGPELVDAIRGSRIAIVLLSKNYTSSTWCLNELVEIIKCREELGQAVMSLFYQVDPTDVKKQTGDFGKVFKKTCKGKTEDEIRRWKRALTEVAQIAGFHSSSGKNEAEMIEDIATDVSNKLNLSAPCSDFDGLVGMDSKMTKMRSLLQLDSDEVRIVGILGPSGIGKTTIARSLFNRHSQDFQLSVFIDNIKRNYAIPACSDDYSVKLNLQKHFMSQLTNETDIKNFSHLGVVKDRLKDKKVLVVLDDVDRSVQLEAMAKETSWFGPGSRIIITTQDRKVLKASGIKHIHKVKLPSNDEALQMFCMYAFDQKYPKDGFQELAWKVRDLVGKLPLGLKVMGSYFRGMSEQDWTEALPRLRTHLDRNREILSILKFSYDALHDEDKSLFLHIACFFNGEPVGIVEGCLAKCFLDVTQGIRVLVEKSLISIEEERIEMSKLLVQLGRQIVQNEFASEPGKRRFLNDASDIGEVLNDDDNAGYSSVIGINLDEGDEITWTSERAFERLSNLQFLRIFGKCVSPQSMNYLSHKLRVLIWRNFKMTCFPSSFNPKFLVKLDMHSSKLVKFWEGIKPLNNLKWMDLRDSRKLEELPDLSTATNLHDLNLSDCERLVELPSSIGNAVNLHQLNFHNCMSLLRLPSSIGNAVNLRELNLEYCSRLVELPSSIWNIVNLELLNLAYCSSLVELPSSKDRSDLLQSYYESSTELGPWIGRISRLKTLQLTGMKKLVSLPPLPDSLLYLYAEQCESLERIDCTFRNPDIFLFFIHCYKLNQEARDLIIQSGQFSVLPAEEVPPCFTHRSSGSSVTVTLNRLPVGKSTKFRVGVICDIDVNDFGETKQENILCRIRSGGKAITTYYKPGRRVYPGHLYKYEIEVEPEDVASTELVFEFEIDYASDCGEDVTWEIKGCGILQLLDVPLLSFRDGDESSNIENFGDGDGSSNNESFGDGDEDYEPEIEMKIIEPSDKEI